MADSKGPTLMIGNKQHAMSKALGAAFLTHQVEQLERSTANNGWRRDGGRNPGRGAGPRTNTQRQVQVPDSPPKNIARRKPSEDRALGEIQRRSNHGLPTKEADIIVVDASVLVHCINQFKSWCKDGREETVVVPLEALNTLDLLKKGTTPLAQRARAASRILEAQVGTNDRIQVQSDAAFVLWDEIPFKAAADADKGTDTSPEWVRRTVCCARYENDQAEPQESQQDKEKASRKVVIAVAQAPAQIPISARHSNDISSPVPLPAPQVPAASKYETRATGTLVRAWAIRAGLHVLEVKATPLPAEEPANGNERSSGVSNHGNGGSGRSPGRSRRTEHGGSLTGNRGPIHNGNSSMVERPPAVQTMMNMVNKPSGGIRLLARGEKLEP